MTDVVARYQHPQGSIITVYDNGAIVKLNPAGKVVSTSATAEKLASGHGGWTLITDDAPVIGTPLPVQKAKPARTLLPMKFKQAEVNELPQFVEDANWVTQQKLDGTRAMLVFEPGKPPWFRNGTGGQLASGAAMGVTNQILRRVPTPPEDVPGYSVDGEVVQGAFWAFDLVVDDANQPLNLRLQALDAWYEAIAIYDIFELIHVLPTARTTEEKQALAVAVYDQGGEGWIAKRLDGGYNWGARVEHSLKLKLTHTVDAVVIAKNRKKEQNFILGLFDGAELIEVGAASAIGKPPAEVGDVLEVRYLYASKDNRRLTQPTVLRLRTDKPVAECTIDQLRFADKSVVLT